MKDFKGKTAGGDITLCDNGKYRWRYDVSLFKTPELFMLVWKIFLFIFLAVFTVSSLTDFVRWGVKGFVSNLPFFCRFFLGMTVITAIGYTLYALLMGGKYCIIFEMDENGIVHKQIPGQANKAKKLAKTTAIAGSLSGSLTIAGLGINSSRTEMYTEFASVKRVKAYPKRNLIKLRKTLSNNQIYVYDDDFEFVKNYILNHCENVKKER